ncbi:phosphomannomutase/phosphoglucomutase [archaeon CG06_land_8_20_14_3_00_37_11]|nr:MAG: phosphomannomutase/phosphoglucomutase [archaeon CG06_land_8_20_14_3_00_37_11]
MERIQMTIFKAYDIRGKYPDEVDERIADKIGKAFAALFKPRVIVVGSDMRLSSDSLSESLINGLKNQGVKVVNVGLVSTPMFYYAVNKLSADAGVMVTASHNPKEYNGFKLVKKGAEPVNYDNGIMQVEKLVQENNFKGAKKAGTVTDADLLDDYVKYVESFADNVKGLKIVVDCGNGMAGKTIKKLLSNLGVDSVFLFDELDGSFPNHDANPFDERNTKFLQKKVLELKSDAGFAFDGDADRLLLVDEKGERVGGDTTTAVIARKILANHKGEKILFDLRSSKCVPEIIKNDNGVPVISRVGHSFIKQRMRDENIIFAGELSGHYYFRDNFYCDSAAIALMFILSLLAKIRKPVSEIIKGINKYYQSGEINKEVHDTRAVLKRVEEHYSDAKISRIDGVTVEYPEWWFNLRESNTEPVIRLNLEADTKGLMNKKLKEVLGLIY